MSNILLFKAKSILSIYLRDAWLLVNAYFFYIILSICLLDAKGY
jgi:hypothetical protein